MPSENHPKHCPFYSTYGIRLNEQTDINVATRVIQNQYESMLLEVSQKPADIAQLEQNGEDWASMFRYSSYLCEHHYAPAFAALEKALAYFNIHGFPPAQSPVLDLFYLLIGIVNQGGLPRFQETSLLSPGFNTLPGASLFAAWGGIPDLTTEAVTGNYYQHQPNI